LERDESGAQAEIEMYVDGYTDVRWTKRSPASDANADRFKPLTAGWIRATVAPDVTVKALYISLDNLARLRLLEFAGESGLGLHRRVLVTVFGEALVDACEDPQT
jgi:hypothetical protein